MKTTSVLAWSSLVLGVAFATPAAAIQLRERVSTRPRRLDRDALLPGSVPGAPSRASTASTRPPARSATTPTTRRTSASSSSATSACRRPAWMPACRSSSAAPDRPPKALNPLPPQPLRIGDDLRVIEGEIVPAPIRDPRDGRRVACRFRLGGIDAHQEGDGAGVPSGIALGVGVDADERERTRRDAGLLLQLTAARVLHRLADLDEAAGQRVRALEGLVSRGG